MSTRATTSQQDTPYDAVADTSAPRPARPGRIRALLKREQGEEDGVFRPVRLPLWMDLGISAGIILFVGAGFAGFIYFLAQTQGR